MELCVVIFSVVMVLCSRSISQGDEIKSNHSFS